MIIETIAVTSIIWGPLTLIGLNKVWVKYGPISEHVKLVKALVEEHGTIDCLPDYNVRLTYKRYTSADDAPELRIDGTIINLTKQDEYVLYSLMKEDTIKVCDKYQKDALARLAKRIVEASEHS